MNILRQIFQFSVGIKEDIPIYRKEAKKRQVEAGKKHGKGHPKVTPNLGGSLNKGEAAET